MLFDAFQLGALSLANRVVMSPMTRGRAVDHNTANAMMASYYAQRASAGLIITEGISPSPNGLGYARIPALYTAEHAEAWKAVTEAVHAQGGKIVAQIMHTGRVTHTDNLPAGARVVSPTAEVLAGEMYTDSQGMQPHSPPQAMSEQDIADAVAEYTLCAQLAVDAGFDGIELHAANGYLLEQFLNANVNHRADAYGGSSSGRNALVLEVARAAAATIGAERVGIRLSPYGVFNHTGEFAGVETQYLELVNALSEMGLLYLHVLDHSAMGAPAVPAAFKARLRAAFNGVFILAGGFDAASAEAALREQQADLIGFGRPFIANPDLVARMQSGTALATADASKFYAGGETGYTDYKTA